MQTELDCSLGHLCRIAALLVDERTYELAGDTQHGVREQLGVCVHSDLTGLDGVANVAHHITHRHLLPLAQRRSEAFFGHRELKQGEQLAVLCGPRSGGADALLDAADGIIYAIDRLFLTATHARLRFAQDLQEQLVLRREVPVEDPFADAEALDDLSDRGGMEAVVREAVGREQHELRAPLLATLRQLPLHRVTVGILDRAVKYARWRSARRDVNRSTMRNTLFTIGGYGSLVHTYLLRLWLPDRPGALGAVASRLGSVGADVVGIEILERGADRAVDELLVRLPDTARTELLLSELAEVDGVAVEDLREVPEARAERGVELLELLAELLQQPDRASMLERLLTSLLPRFDLDWATVVDVQRKVVEVGVGEPPSDEWVLGYALGAVANDAEIPGRSGDVAHGIVSTGVVMLVGRGRYDLHDRERREFEALARICGTALPASAS